jgi:hypothetical protein
MKQSEILGLFTTPGDVRDYERAQLMKEAQMYTDPIAQQMYMATSGLAGAVGGAFGVQPRGMADAQKLEQIRESVPFDANNQSEYYTTLAQQLINQGLTKAGYQALELARKAKVDESKIAKESDKTGKLDVATRGRIDEETVKAYDAYDQSNRAMSIAARFDTINPRAGVAGEIEAAFVSATGTQGEAELLRQDFENLAGARTLTRLPTGPASDKDMLFASKGFPATFDNPKAIAKALRGYAKLQAVQAAYHEFYAKYLAENPSASGVLPAWFKYRDDNMATILSNAGLNINTEDEDVTDESAEPRRIDASGNFGELSAKDRAQMQRSRQAVQSQTAPAPNVRGGRSKAARSQ